MNLGIFAALAASSTSGPSAEDLGAIEQAMAPSSPIARVSEALSSMNPALSFVLDGALAAFSEDEPLQLGGHDPTETGFNFQQLELHVGASVDPYFKLDLQLVFSPEGVEIEEAYATTLRFPWNLQARAGQFLTRFGRLNPTHPHAWSFVDQPLVNGKFFGPEGSRGLGVELSWLSPLPWYLELVGSANGASGECCARSFFGGRDVPVRGPEDFLYTTAIKQFFPFGEDWSLSWGLSAQLGPSSTGDGNRTDIYGTDLYLRWRPIGSAARTAVSLQVEGLLRRRQVPGDVLQDAGLYAQLVWKIDPEWETGARYENVGGVSADPLDPEWSAGRQRAAVQITHYPSHFSRVRLEGSFDEPKWRDDPIWAAMLALEVQIGAHAAHTF